MATLVFVLQVLKLCKINSRKVQIKVLLNTPVAFVLIQLYVLIYFQNAHLSYFCSFKLHVVVKSGHMTSSLVFVCLQKQRKCGYQWLFKVTQNMIISGKLCYRFLHYSYFVFFSLCSVAI